MKIVQWGSGKPFAATYNGIHYPNFSMWFPNLILKQQQLAMGSGADMRNEGLVRTLIAAPVLTFGASLCQPCSARPPWSYRLRT
jgi:predicted acetyltransferase